MAIVSNLNQGIQDKIIKRSIDVVISGLNITNIEYDTNQNPIRIDYENDIKMFLTYDVIGNCTEMDVRISGVTVEKWVYVYDSNNLLRTATKIVG